MKKLNSSTRTFTLVLASMALTSFVNGQSLPIYLDKHKSLEARVSDLFNRLTLDEKMDVLTGTDFTTRPIPRLGVPALAMADAGQGVRGGSNTTQGPATAFPSAVAMASTWDPGLVGRIAKAIGEEAHNKGTGVQILLGPAINIHRSPLGGRNGEYFTEDPFLDSRLTVDYVKGMQSTGVAACLKHYAANNEEVDRDFVNVIVGERTLREIYLPAFEAGVKEGHAWTVMSSYNVVNGYHSSASKYLLTDVLKKGWGFDGMVMSDWGGVHETVGAVNAGNDLEMPGPGFLKKENIERAFKSGQISLATIDDNVRRILRTAVRVGVLDGGYVPDHSIVNSAAHKHLAFEAAAKGIVLLKNTGAALPFNRKAIKSIAVIGPGADSMQVDALGSPTVQPFYTIQPLAGLKAAAQPGTKFNYARGLETGEPVPASELTLPDGSGHGLLGEYFANRDLRGPSAFTRNDSQIQFNWTGKDLNGLGTTNYSVRWTGKLTAPSTGRYHFVISADDGCRMFIDGKQVIDHWIDTAEVPVATDVNLVGGKSYDLRIEYYQAAGDAVVELFWTKPGAGRYAEAIKAARLSDVAIVCVSTLGQEGEGTDRPSMPLPSDQDSLIQAVAAVNKRTIVVLNNGTPVEMTGWLKTVPAVVETWFPGQEGGAALAAILFGDINPSGKLPDTLAARREDYPDFGNFPGTKGKVKYAEGIYVGYRHFDKKNIAPLFPFGYGLSYTSFGYGKATVAEHPDGSLTVNLNVTNTGKRAGAEVIQVYVHDLSPKVDKPVKELRGFQKVTLASGQTQRVSIILPRRSFEYFDVQGKCWKADAGRYELQVGSSSRDIRQKATVVLKSDLHNSIR